MSATIMDGVAIARETWAEVALGVRSLKEQHGTAPGLAIVLSSDDLTAAVYVRRELRAARNAGMQAWDIVLPDATPTDRVINVVEALNGDDRFDGVVVHLPLPDHVASNAVMRALCPEKDVDGKTSTNLGLLAAGEPCYVPPTAAGILELLLRYGRDPDGRHVVICGRSPLVGGPLSILLAQPRPGGNATVTLCHTRTANLAGLTRQADILIVAIKQPRFVTGDMVSAGVVVVDAGIHREDAPELERGYRLVGDVDFESVAEKASAITPVPGGVGAMTVSMLLRNTLEAARRRRRPPA